MEKKSSNALIHFNGGRRRRIRRRMRSGATVVEFALVAPIFFLFLLASFEMGWLNVVNHTADHAAYEAARHVMVPGATAAEARQRAESILRIIGARGVTVDVSPETITPEDDEVTVTVQIPMNRNGLIVPRFTRNKIIVGQSTLRTERGGT